ncbi:MAG: MlaC/ttg2D family ABC transporter substrate-binding protein [Pseudomonadota bacterium]
MKISLKISLIAGLLAAYAASAAGSADIAPDQLVRDNVQEVLEILKQDKDVRNGNQKRIMELADSKVLPHFDMRRMTMLAVGKNWRNATPEQQDALVKEFSTLLVRTYSNALVAYKNQNIDVKPLNMRAGDAEVTVKTQVNQSGAEPIAIDYRMEKTSEGWKAFDVSVGGVSLVTNYRSTFNDEIRKSGIDGLLKLLTEKNKVLDGGKK